MRHALAAVGVVSALAASAAVAPAPQRSTLAPGWDETAPLWSPDGSVILVQRAWVSPRMGQLQHLTAVDPRGERRRIGRSARTGHEEWDTGGEWSPDGKLVAFTRNVGLGQWLHVYVAGVDTSVQRRLSPFEAEDHSPTWAPDGQRLAFVRNDRIAAVRADGTGASVITSGDDHSPRWSPDGERIAFLRQGQRSGTSAVFVVRADGSELRRVTPDGDYELGGWSPDSTRLLAVTGAATGRDRVVVLDADGRRPRTLGPGTAPDWSPTGDRIAFYRADGLYVVASRGGAARRVFRFAERRSVNDEDDAAPDWSPDGRRLVFAQPGGCIAWGVYVLDLASARAQRITNDCHIAARRAATSSAAPASATSFSHSAATTSSTGTRATGGTCTPAATTTTYSTAVPARTRSTDGAGTTSCAAGRATTGSGDIEARTASSEGRATTSSTAAGTTTGSTEARVTTRSSRATASATGFAAAPGATASQPTAGTPSRATARSSLARERDGLGVDAGACEGARAAAGREGERVCSL